MKIWNHIPFLSMMAMAALGVSCASAPPAPTPVAAVNPAPSMRFEQFYKEVNVTPKNQKGLGLEITSIKHEKTYIVDFVVSSTGSLRGLTNIGFYTGSENFTSPFASSVPFMGLTWFPRDSRSNPKKAEEVHGIRMWIGEDAITNAKIQFEYRDWLYSVPLAPFTRKSP